MQRLRNIAFVISLAAVALPVAAAMAPIGRPDVKVTYQADLATLDAVTRTGAALELEDPFCDTPEVVAISLVEDYFETLQFSLWGKGEARLDLWSANATGTWTLVYTRTDGVACVAASGTGWADNLSSAEAVRLVGFTR